MARDISSEFLDDVVGSFTDVKSELSAYLAIHGVFLGAQNRSDFQECESSASDHQFTRHNDLTIGQECRAQSHYVEAYCPGRP